MATSSHSLKTPRQHISFQDSKHEFGFDTIPDSGSSRTIFAKNVLDSEGIEFQPNLDGEELFNASKDSMVVNGTVYLTANFNGKSALISGLVSEDLQDNILLSWHDAENLGSITITRNADEYRKLFIYFIKFASKLSNSM